MSKYKSVEIPLDLYAKYGNSPMRIRDTLWRALNESASTEVAPARAPEKRDPDRHAAEVIHTNEEPTEAQINYLTTLCATLKEPVPTVDNRLHASELINERKARVSALGNQSPNMATEKQKTLINWLLESRKLDTEIRQQIQAEVDQGVSFTVGDASDLIDQLRELPKLEEGGV